MKATVQGSSAASSSDLKPDPLSTKQKLLLVLFSLEVIFYPFIIGLKRIEDTSELGPADLLSKETFLGTGIGTMFVWVPIALVLGFLLGRRLWNHPGVVRFFRERDISPDEIPPIVGIFAPLSVIATVLVIYGIALCLVLWFITIPLYLIIRFWKKKGIRHLLGWIVSLVGRIAIRLKRMSYVGYVLPILFGSVFAKRLSRGSEETAGGTYVLILLQMVVLIALWKNIRTPRAEPSPAAPPQYNCPDPLSRPCRRRHFCVDARALTGHTDRQLDDPPVHCRIANQPAITPDLSELVFHRSLPCPLPEPLKASAPPLTP